jgi:transcriptional regulator with XRE-family HTH domain
LRDRPWKRFCEKYRAMGGREAFGPNLRRLRIQRGVSLQQIATETNVSEVLWAAMERNDFSRWPNGIFARAYIRDYAKIVGADPDVTVDEFCRWFPQGDRRAARTIQEHAEIVNHDLRLKEEIPPEVGEDRRWSPDKAPAPTAPQAPQAGVFGRLRRALSRA